MILAVGSRSAPPPWRWSAPNSKRPGAGTYSTNRLGALDLLRVRAVILSLVSLLKNLSCTKTCPVWESVCR